MKSFLLFLLGVCGVVYGQYSCFDSLIRDPTSSKALKQAQECVDCLCDSLGDMRAHDHIANSLKPQIIQCLYRSPRVTQFLVHTEGDWFHDKETVLMLVRVKGSFVVSISIEHHLKGVSPLVFILIGCCLALPILAVFQLRLKYKPALSMKAFMLYYIFHV
jgi:hypothetical protein